jgi:hypothetical protein
MPPLAEYVIVSVQRNARTNTHPKSSRVRHPLIFVCRPVLVAFAVISSAWVLHPVWLYLNSADCDGSVHLFMGRHRRILSPEMEFGPAYVWAGWISVYRTRSLLLVGL